MVRLRLTVAKVDHGLQGLALPLRLPLPLQMLLLRRLFVPIAARLHLGRVDNKPPVER